MSRYIDTKWLEDNAKEYSLGYYEEDEWAIPLNILDSAPSIETKQIKYYDEGENVWKIGEVIVDGEREGE